MLRVGYLGPPGTFCEQALLTQPDLAAGELVDLKTIIDVIDATVSGGQSNSAQGQKSSVLGGDSNTASSNCEAIPSAPGSC